jgi:PmbA protein
MQDILAALRGKTEQAEVYSLEEESTLVSFEANVMKSARVEQKQGTALRGVVKGRLGFTAAGGNMAKEELINNLLASAQYGDEVPVSFPSASTGPQVTTYDPTLGDVPFSRLVEIGREIIAALLEADADAKIGVDIERGLTQWLLCNSAGTQARQQKTSFSVSISVERVRGDDVLLIYDWVNGISLTDAYREAMRHLATKIELAKKSASLAAGRMPVLFSPVGGLVLALPIMQASDGKSVQRGISPMSDKLGQTIFDRKITLWDDPTLAGRPGSGSHDGEGVPCRRKALIQQGTCNSFLYDLKTAALMGTQSTGNGARGLFSPPYPSPSNLVMEAGKSSLTEIMADIKHGLLVEFALGLGQGNTISGAFSNTLGLAYVIEGGEIVGRVKDVSIAGNIYEHLREVAGVSQESDWVYGQIKMPYILLPELNVTCKS